MRGHGSKIIAVLFFVFLILSFILINQPVLAAVSLLLSALALAIGLSHFLSKLRIRTVGRTKIEESSILNNFVFRGYTKAKNIWVMYDKRKKSFRKAEFNDLPAEVGLTLLLGIALLYASFLIISTINQAIELIAFRATALVVFLVIGFYNIFVSLDRLETMGNKNSERVSKILNRNTFLKNIIERENLSFEITPNFLLLEGFVTSIELVSHRKHDSKSKEVLIVEIAKVTEKIK